MTALLVQLCVVAAILLWKTRSHKSRKRYEKRVGPIFDEKIYEYLHAFGFTSAGKVRTGHYDEVFTLRAYK